MAVTISGDGTLTGSINLPSGTQLDSALLEPGIILQTLSASASGNPSVAVNSYTDISGLSVTITPSSSSSKFLALLSITLGHNTNSGANCYTQLVRDASALTNSEETIAGSGHSFSGNLVYLDSPATASAVTYKGQFRTNSGTYTMYRGTLTILEVAA